MNTPAAMDRRTFLSALVVISSMLAACNQGESAPAPQVEEPAPSDGGKLGGDEPEPETSEPELSDDAEEPAPALEAQPEQPAVRRVFLATSLKDSVAAHGFWEARQCNSEVVYDAAGNVVHRVADTGFAGYVITADYVYDVEGNVIGATIDTGDAGSDGSVAPFNSTWMAWWSDDHRSISWESDETPYGSFYVYCNYYADGKLASKAVSIIGPQAGYSGAAEFIYNERGLLTTVTENPGFGGSRNFKEMAYDRSGRLVSYACEADGESCTYSYNAQGKLLEKHHTLRNYSSTTTCTYDDAGILVSATRTTSPHRDGCAVGARCWWPRFSAPKDNGHRRDIRCRPKEIPATPSRPARRRYHRRIPYSHTRRPRCGKYSCCSQQPFG